MLEAVVNIDFKMKEAKSSGGGLDDDSSSSSKGNSKKPTYSRFTQQELPAWKPILTPALVISTFTIIGVVFIPIGLASLLASQSVVEIVDRYDADCLHYPYNELATYLSLASVKDRTCTRKLTVPKHMKGPVFIYYQLDNFHQNHRRYVRSRSDKQLQSAANEAIVDDCKPEQYTADGKPIVPCGLVAWSLFNDTYKFSVDSKILDVNKKGIAWKSDKEHKFGSDVYPKNFQSGIVGGAALNSSIPLSEQEDLMVWMRTAALPNFRKLYGRIETDLEANDVIEVEIQNNYNTYSFGGKKSLVLSTTSWLGGKNNSLGLAYLTMGSICLFLAIFFVFIYIFRPRPMGDPSYLSWNKQQPEQKE